MDYPSSQTGRRAGGGQAGLSAPAASELDENFADTAQVAAEQVETRTLAAQLQDQLDDVEAALGRIDAGTYGTCEVCDKPVTAARLEAMPSTRFCIDHA